ncbi:MAG: hypothetical protein ACP5XB_03160 [Isosphaeraceae bacterium]
MANLEGLSARIDVSIQDARVTFTGGQMEIHVPRIQVAIPREDCTEATRRLMPESIVFPTMEFGLGQRITGRVTNIHAINLRYEGNEVHFQARPGYRVQLDQKLPGLGWRKVAAISGKVAVPGLIRLSLDNPGAALPAVRIAYEIAPGVPDVLNIPDWAETTFRPDGKNLRDLIREILTRREMIEPFSRFAGDPALEHVRIQDLSMSTDATFVRLDFAVVAQVEH